MEDNRSDPITVPGQIPVFGQRYSTLYVSDYVRAHNCLVQSRVHRIFHQKLSQNVTSIATLILGPLSS